MKKYLLLILVLCLPLGQSQAEIIALGRRGSNYMQPPVFKQIIAHEWGVYDFDWAKGHTLPEKLPEFVYTDKKAGEQHQGKAVKQSKVKIQKVMMKARKPLLYFYSKKDTIVDVELRFAKGKAVVWRFQTKCCFLFSSL